MRSVDLKVLKNSLGKYVRLAAGGETVLVTNRGRVVAEIVAPKQRHSPLVGDPVLAEAVREGLIAPPTDPGSGPTPRLPVMSFEDLMRDIEHDREDR